MSAVKANKELLIHLKRAPEREPVEEAPLLFPIAVLRFRTTGKSEL